MFMTYNQKGKKVVGYVPAYYKKIGTNIYIGSIGR